VEHHSVTDLTQTHACTAHSEYELDALPTASHHSFRCKIRVYFKLSLQTIVFMYGIKWKDTGISVECASIPIHTFISMLSRKAQIYSLNKSNMCNLSAIQNANCIIIE